MKFTQSIESENIIWRNHYTCFIIVFYFEGSLKDVFVPWDLGDFKEGGLV